MRRSTVRIRPPAYFIEMNLIDSVSGLRGIVGDSLSPSIIIEKTMQFVCANGGNVYFIARDTRPSSKAISNLISGTLTMMGKRVVDFGVIPTPTLLFNVRELKADGGFMVTASHNPLQWNGIKFVERGGQFPVAIKKVRTPCTGSEQLHFYPAEEIKRGFKRHIEKILNSGLLRSSNRKLKVAVDTVNGAGFEAVPGIVRALGHDVFPLATEPNGLFPHPPEPKREHLRVLDDILKQGLCDIGFGVDPDADRLITGISGVGVLSEEYTLPLALLNLTDVSKIVVNYSTSMLVEDVAKKLSATVIRTRVGEANVVAKMKELHARFGGEGNGGVIFEPVNMARDSLVGIAMVLSLASEYDLKEVIRALPSYKFVKTKLPVSRKIDPTSFSDIFKGCDTNYEDGIYARCKKDLWIQIRKSNTEPVVRIYAEGAEEQEVYEILDRVKNRLE